MLREKIFTYLALHLIFCILEYVYHTWCFVPWYGIHAHMNSLCVTIRQTSHRISDVISNGVLMGVSVLVELAMSQLKQG